WRRRVSCSSRRACTRPSPRSLPRWRRVSRAGVADCKQQTADGADRRQSKAPALPRRTMVSGQSPRFRPILEQFAPYRPGGRVASPDGRSFKLASNESPFVPLPSVAKAISTAAGEVHRYPDNSAAELTEAIAARYGVPPEHIAVGCGSVG